MLEIKNINLNLKGFSLKDINLSVNNGEYFVILGPSGSGKTLFLETIAGMYDDVTGTIKFDNAILSNLEIEKREIGFVYQRYELFPFLNVRDNIAFGLKNKGIDKKIINEKVKNHLRLFKIEHLEKRYPRNLSGGESQRVALLRALIISPKILLLDEPLSALDRFTKDILIEEIKNINKIFKTTVLHVTHDIDEAIYLGDKIGIMKKGKLSNIMTSSEFKNEVNSGRYKELFKGE